MQDDNTQAFEKELRELKITQALGQRQFVSDRAKEDFVQLMMPRVKRTIEGYFGEDDTPLGTFILREYEHRRDSFAPTSSSAQQTGQPSSQANEITLDEIHPRMTEEARRRAWEAIGRGLDRIGANSVISGRK